MLWGKVDETLRICPEYTGYTKLWGEMNESVRNIQGIQSCGEK
jgi:hypothetical protein